MTSYPHIITDGNRQSIHVKYPVLRLKPMPGSIDSDIRPNQTVVAYADFCQVEHCTIVVGMKIVAHMNIQPEITMEIVINCWIAANRTKQFSKNFLLFAISDTERLFSCFVNTETFALRACTSLLISVLL